MLRIDTGQGHSRWSPTWGLLLVACGSSPADANRAPQAGGAMGIGGSVASLGGRAGAGGSSSGTPSASEGGTSATSAGGANTFSGMSDGGDRAAAGDGNEPAAGASPGAGGNAAGGASAIDAGAGAGGEAALELCGNSRDDDGDGFIDEGCAPPVNDSCAGAIELALPSGGRRDPIDGATRSANDCGSGPELWYKVTLPGRAVFYADSFGSEFPTGLSLRESCGADALQCSASGACSTGNQAFAMELGAGTYYVAVHASAVATPSGNLKLNWGTLAPPNGKATLISGSGVYQGTTAGSSSVRPKNCSGGAGPEDLFYFTLCPGVFIMENLNGCRSTYETTLYVKQGDGGEVVCGDSDCSDPEIPAQPMYGPGLFGVYVDGRYTTGKGDYTATIVWSSGSFR